jgi:hypothetical protein
MNSSFEQTLVEAWRQTLVENAEVVELGTERFPVRLSARKRAACLFGALPPLEL